MKQLTKFCIVGCLNFGISWTVFSLSYRYWPFSAMLDTGNLSIDGAVANVTGYVAGMVNSFLWNRFWTFKAVEETQKQAVRFIVTNLACLLISTLSVFVGTDLHHWPYNLVWIITMALVTILNFVASKYWVFAKVTASMADTAERVA